MNFMSKSPLSNRFDFLEIAHRIGMTAEVNLVSLNTVKERAIKSLFSFVKMCLAQDFKSIAQDTCFRVSYLCVTC